MAIMENIPSSHETVRSRSEPLVEAVPNIFTSQAFTVGQNYVCDFLDVYQN